MNGSPSVRVALFNRECGSKSSCRWLYCLGIYKKLENLESITINLGGIKDFSHLSKIKNLKFLEIFQVRGLDNLDFLSNLRSLQYLYLQNLSNIQTLPNMRNMAKLRRLIIDNLKGLNSLSSVISIPNLEEFCLYRGNNQSVEAVAVVLNNEKLKRVVAYFGTQKKNESFKALVLKTNIEYWTKIDTFNFN